MGKLYWTFGPRSEPHRWCAKCHPMEEAKDRELVRGSNVIDKLAYRPFPQVDVFSTIGDPEALSLKAEPPSLLRVANGRVMALLEDLFSEEEL